jgi:N utilization substance protein A
VTSISLDDENMKASVFLKPDQVSLAIGKGGSNIKLAGRITGYEIDVYRDTDDIELEDVDLDEFRDEIEDWVIDEFKNIGCDTARSVLELSRSELERRTDLEIETIDEILKILASEFEDEDNKTQE